MYYVSVQSLLLLSLIFHRKQWCWSTCPFKVQEKWQKCIYTFELPTQSVGMGIGLENQEAFSSITNRTFLIDFKLCFKVVLTVFDASMNLKSAGSPYHFELTF